MKLIELRELNAKVARLTYLRARPLPTEKQKDEMRDINQKLDPELWEEICWVRP